MSVSVLYTPETPLKSFTHHIWTVTSNAANIRQIAVEVELNSTTIFSASYQSSLAGTAVFDIDLQEWLRDQLSYDIQTPGQPALAYVAPNSSFTYDNVKFFEYADVNGQLTLVGGSNSVGDKVTVNAVRQTTNSATLDGYKIRTRTATPWTYDKYLTNVPALGNGEREVEIQEGESYTLSLYANAATTNSIAIVWQNESGAQLQLDRIDYTGTAGRYDICVGLENLAQAGLTPPAGAVRYYVYSADYTAPTLTRQSEFFFFKIVSKCSGTRIHFLNRLGGFDSYTFGESQRSIEVSSTSFEKYLGKDFTQQNRGNQYKYRDASNSFTCVTGLISDKTVLWLEELLSTAVAYLEVGGELIPILISDRSSITKGYNRNELTISYELANNVRNQRL